VNILGTFTAGHRKKKHVKQVWELPKELLKNFTIYSNRSTLIDRRHKMSMTVREMIDELEEIAAEYGDDVDVRMAQQPKWAFEYGITEIVAVNISEETCNVCQGSCYEEDEDGKEVKCKNCNSTGKCRKDKKQEDEVVAYLGEGRQIGYLPGVASEALGWR
jgi:hypothetical protein